MVAELESMVKILQKTIVELQEVSLLIELHRFASLLVLTCRA